MKLEDIPFGASRPLLLGTAAIAQNANPSLPNAHRWCAAYSSRQARGPRKPTGR